MRIARFAHVPRIVGSDKYFDISREAIERALAQTGKCEVTAVHDFKGDDGEEIAVDLKLNITARIDLPQSWSMSLKLHKIRIDCIDYEPVYDCIDGTKNSGWHRHCWNEKHESAESDKVPASIGSIQTREEFLIRGFSEMRIVLNAADDGSQQELRLA